MSEFESEILQAGINANAKVLAWCILPNHYHLVVFVTDLKTLRGAIKKAHGRTARYWNLEDGTPGRRVWFNYFDRDMKSERHYFATLNYVNNNAVHHGCVAKWKDWPYSSAHQYRSAVGSSEAERIWREFPVLDYGRRWDD